MASLMTSLMASLMTSLMASLMTSLMASLIGCLMTSLMTSLIRYTDDERAQLRRIEPSTWHHHELAGEWAGSSAGGCRNHASWVCNPICMMDRSNASAHYGAPPSPQVCNPIYMMRASRTATCELFLRQESRERLPEGGGFTEGQVSALMTFGVDALMTFDDL